MLFSCLLFIFILSKAESQSNMKEKTIVERAQRQAAATLAVMMTSSWRVPESCQDLETQSQTHFINNWEWQDPKSSSCNPCCCRAEGPSTPSWMKAMTVEKATYCSVLLSASATHDFNGSQEGGYSTKQQAFVDLSSECHKSLSFKDTNNTGT